MRRIVLLAPLVLAACNRDAKLHRAVAEALPGYDQGPDRYVIDACEIGTLPPGEKQAFDMDHPFEKPDPAVATCHVTFYFRDFPRAGEMKPQPTSMRFVWIDNASKWMPWSPNVPLLPPAPKKK